MTDFEIFQSEFRKWQEKFGLNGYQVYFKEEELNGSFANIIINQGEMVATVKLNTKCPEEAVPFKDVRKSAKHEALHLLIGRLEQDGRWRYSSEAEIYEAAEELVNRLEALIPDGN